MPLSSSSWYSTEPICANKDVPNTVNNAVRSSATLLFCQMTALLWRKMILRDGRIIAYAITKSSTLFNSSLHFLVLLENCFLTGRFLNKFAAVTIVPVVVGFGLVATIFPSRSNVYNMPTSSDFVFVNIDKLLTDESEARASPRKPYVCRDFKSSSVKIFDV